MINNINLILPHFYFNEANNMFMHCQIVQRAKDHKGERVREGAIKTYFIRSREHLERTMPEIILLCEHYGARAYINVAGKDFDQLQKLMLKKLCDDVCQNNVTSQLVEVAAYSRGGDMTKQVFFDAMASANASGDTEMINTYAAYSKKVVL